MSKLIWTKSDGYGSYNHLSDLGSASVEEIVSDIWRWEAYSSNETQMFDMDCWWGLSSSLEEAQLDAEGELLRFGSISKIDAP